MTFLLMGCGRSDETQGRARFAAPHQRPFSSEPKTQIAQLVAPDVFGKVAVKVDDGARRTGRPRAADPTGLRRTL
jgi:hypothetical protein